MTVLAYSVAILCWPIVTFWSLTIVRTELMPRGMAPFYRRVVTAKAPEATFRRLLWLVDIFIVLGAVASQVVAVLIGKGIFALCGCEATRRLGVAFGIWCLVFWYRSFLVKLGGRLDRHGNLSLAVGLTIGWAVGTFWLL